MMNVAYSMLNIFALIILIILMVIFFSKKRLHNIEDNTYGWLLIVSFFTISTGITLGFLLDANIVNQNMMIIIFNKLLKPIVPYPILACLSFFEPILFLESLT